jgi:hypothetical protein
VVKFVVEKSHNLYITDGVFQYLHEYGAWLFILLLGSSNIDVPLTVLTCDIVGHVFCEVA